MTVTYVGSASAEATGVTPPVHVTGDLLIAFAFRSGTNAAPTVPAGWITLGTGFGNSCGYALAYRYATGAGTSGTGFTNAASVAIHVYRDAADPKVGTWQTGSSTSLIYPALAGLATTSWVLSFAGCRATDTTTISTAPTSRTNRRSQLGSVVDTVSSDTAGALGATSIAASTVAVGGTANGWITANVEITDPPVPTLSNGNVTQSGSTVGTMKITSTATTGIVYAVSTANNATAPTAAQIRNGADGSGGAAANASNIVLDGSTNIATFLPFPNVVGNTDYDLWFVHQISTNRFSTPVKVDYRTPNLADTGWLAASDISSDYGGDGAVSWTNLINDGSQNYDYAQVDLINYFNNPGSFSDYFVAKQFGLNIPRQAVITGIQVKLAGYLQGSFFLDHALQLLVSYDSKLLQNITPPQFTGSYSELVAGNVLGGVEGTWGLVDVGSNGSGDRPLKVTDLDYQIGIKYQCWSYFAAPEEPQSVFLDNLMLKVSYYIPAPVVGKANLFSAFP